MMNITVSIDDEIYRRVQIGTAELNTPVSALVQEQLADISSQTRSRVSPEEFERLERLERALHTARSAQL